MTLEEIKHVYEIANAALNGKTIQCADDNGNYIDVNMEKDVPIEYLNDIMRFRVRPYELEYVPYTSMEQFLAAQKEHGPYIKVKRRYIMPYEIKEEGIYAKGDPDDVTYKELCEIEGITWQDGTRCGMLVKRSTID